MAEPTKELLQTIAAHADPRVPLSIVLTMAERESGFDPTRMGAAGEYGLMQLLPKTVREELRYNGPLEKLLEPGFNVELGTRYLTILKERFDEWPVAVRAYNGSGPAAREYAAGVFKRLPTWDKFVRENLEFFKRAIGSRGAGMLGLLAAVAVALLLLASLQRKREA